MDNKVKSKSAPDYYNVAPEILEIDYEYASDIIPQPIYWLWPDRIPLGEVTVFAGLPGKGKSQLLLYFADLVSRGGILEIGTERCQFPQGKTIILSAEDNSKSLIVPRLKALGADLSQIIIVKAVKSGFDSDGNQCYSMFDLSSDIKKLNKLAHHEGGVKLFIIDPYTAYLGNSKESSNAEMRNLIMQLGNLSEEHMAAMFLNTHLNKQTQQSGALARIQGSMAIVAAPRAVYMIGVHPDNPSQRILTLGKTNVGEHFEHGYVYELEKVKVPVMDKGKEIESIITRIKWIGIEKNISADDLVDPDKRKDNSKKERAKEIILEMLQDHGEFRDVIMKECENEGIACSTVNDAKNELGNIYSDNSRGKGNTRWYIKA